MAFKHGKGTKILFDQYDLSAYLNNHEVTADVDLPDTTTYGANAHRRQVVGLKDAQVTLSGFHATDAGGTQPVLTAAYGAANPSVVTIAKEGFTIGNPSELISAREKSYKSGSPVDGVVPASVDLLADNGLDYGKSLHDLTAETATGNNTSVDNAVLTSNGGVGHQNTTAVSGTTPTNTLKIQHSTNDSVWVDLITFAGLTTLPAAERIEVAAGTTVNRYLRSTRTIGGGTPSYTYAVAFARR